MSVVMVGLGLVLESAESLRCSLKRWNPVSQGLMVLSDPEPSVLWLESWVAAKDSWKNRSESVAGCEER